MTVLALFVCMLSYAHAILDLGQTYMGRPLRVYITVLPFFLNSYLGHGPSIRAIHLFVIIIIFRFPPPYKMAHICTNLCACFICLHAISEVCDLFISSCGYATSGLHSNDELVITRLSTAKKRSSTTKLLLISVAANSEIV